MSNSFVMRQKSFRSKENRKPKSLENAASIHEHKFMFTKDQLGYICEDWQDQAVVVARLAEIGGKQGLEYALRTSLHSGLLKDEVALGGEWEGQYTKRKEHYGVNEFTKKDATPFCMLVLDQLKDPFLVILIIAAFINIIIGIFLQGECPQNTPEWIDGLAILAAVSIVVFVGSYQDYSQEAQFRAKEDETAEKTTFVVRGENPKEPGKGIEYEINQKHVLVGDMVILKTGDTIPCDGIYVSGTEDFKITEAAMTGETLPLGKSHKSPLILGGTQIVAGEGIMLSVCVGDDTQWGQMKLGVQGDPEDTPLQEDLDLMAKRIGYFGMVAAFVLFCVLTIKWAIDTPAGEHAFTADMKIPQFLILAVTIIVVAVPEGLPLAVTISLSYSMKRMMSDNNFVRHLAACETMSNATTICSDKTGTLTENRMTVNECSIGGRFFKDARGEKGPGGGRVGGIKQGDIHEEAFKRVAVGLAVNSKSFEVTVDEDDPNAVEQLKHYGPEFTGGNATEYALLKWASFNLGCDYVAERRTHLMEKPFPFSSAVKASAVLVKESEDAEDYIMYLKGAAEKCAALCNRVLDEDGNVRDITPRDQDKIEADISRMAKVGLRCVGMAWRSYREEELLGRTDGGVPRLEIHKVDENGDFTGTDFKDFIWIAVAGIKDPVRREVPGAVLDAQRAGVVVRMVTGDHLDTAKFIAKECHIYTSKKHVCMTGAQFRQLGDKEKEEKLPWLRVMARSQPQDKENLVRWYKAHNDIVAVTGDGANDALALKEADVGLAMGIQGTDVAKEAADIIIMDDNFKSIVASVRWGRCVYDNIRKFLQFQLTVNVVACVLSLIAAFMDDIQMDAVLTPIQLLWVNLIMDTMAALALGTERPNDKLLDRHPFRKEAGLISPIMWRFIAGHSIYQLVWLFVWIFFGWQWFNFGTHVVNQDALPYYPGTDYESLIAEKESCQSLRETCATEISNCKKDCPEGDETIYDNCTNVCDAVCVSDCINGHGNYDAAACAYSSSTPSFMGQKNNGGASTTGPNYYQDPKPYYGKALGEVRLKSNDSAAQASDFAATKKDDKSTWVQVVFAIATGTREADAVGFDDVTQEVELKGHNRYVVNTVALGYQVLPQEDNAGMTNKYYMCEGNKFRHCSEASASGEVCASKGLSSCSGDGCTLRSASDAKLRYIIPCRSKVAVAPTQANDREAKDTACDSNFTQKACNDVEACAWHLPSEYPQWSASKSNAGLDFEEKCIYPPRCDHSAITCVMAHKSMAFNIFIWCQIFNEINARKVNGEWNTFEHFFQNPMYGIIILITIVTQVILIEVFGASGSLQAIFKTTPATWDMWLVSLGIGAGSILWNFALNLLSLFECFNRAEANMQLKLPEGTFAQDLVDTHVDVNTKRKDAKGIRSSEVELS